MNNIKPTVFFFFSTYVCLIIFGCSKTPAPPTQAQICEVMDRQIDYDNRRSERMLKTCTKGGWKNNEVVALECMLYLGQLKNYDQPVIYKIKKCEKIGCQTTKKENQFLCEYFLDVSASNQSKRYEDHRNKTNKEVKKGLFTLIPQVWDYSPYSEMKKTSKWAYLTNDIKCS